MLCEYKNLFGAPLVGFHRDRLMGFAQNDIIGTVMLAYIISKYANVTFIRAFIYCILFAIVIHKLFCVNTKLNILLFNY